MCFNLKWDWLPASGMRHASLFASMQHVDRQSYYGERDATYIYGPSLPRTLLFGAKLSI